MEDYKYVFSIVMPAYNTGEFLSEALDSVFTQDFGYDRIQMIFVNDGSTDNTEEIISSYQKKYPDNFIGISKENGGVSSARNEGLKFVQGKYVNFMDSDDKLAPDCLSKVYDFFEEHYDETDVVSVPLIWFDGKRGPHHYNYKFNDGSRVIDLNEEWDSVQTHANSAFVKSSVLKDNYYFDERLSIGEDLKFIQEVLLNKQTIGVVSDTSYLYRKRSGENKSALDNSQDKFAWYLPMIKFNYLELLELSSAKLNYIPKFIQYVVCSDMSYKIRKEKNPFGLMSHEEESEYIDGIKKIISQIDDDVIAKHRMIPRELKYSMFKIKGSALETRYEDDSCSLYLGEDNVYSFSKDQIKIDFIEVSGKKCTVSGRLFTISFHSKPVVVLLANQKEICCETKLYKKTKCIIDDERVMSYSFSAEIELGKVNSFEVTVQYDGIVLAPMGICYGKFAPLSDTFSKMYSKAGRYLIYRKGKGFAVDRSNLWKHLIKEIGFVRNLLSFKKARRSRRAAARKAVLVRTVVGLNKVFKRKPIWIIRDRVISADDNGLAMFEYMNREHPEIKTIFAISKKTSEYEEISSIGKVIDIFSWKYKLLYLISDYIVSSAAEDDVFNPFGAHSEAYKDLKIRCKFIFLQHGVTKDDISGWINRYNKNIYGFVASAQREYDYLLNPNFAYQPENIWLTGLPRYDKLTDQKEKIISILPTWRSYLLTNRTKDGVFLESKKLPESIFLRQYSSLLNNKLLLETAKEKGYRIQFVLHPMMRIFRDLFESEDPVVEIVEDRSYNQLFKESSLMISDYSSVVMDFAYLKKPVLYYQFDNEEFFSNHTYQQGYYSYEDDGFGEVAYDEDTLVNLIVEYLNNGCEMKDMYADRVDGFFKYHDRKNCERVYNEIMKREG